MGPSNRKLQPSRCINLTNKKTSTWQKIAFEIVSFF